MVHQTFSLRSRPQRGSLQYPAVPSQGHTLRKHPSTGKRSSSERSLTFGNTTRRNKVLSIVHSHNEQRTTNNWIINTPTTPHSTIGPFELCTTGYHGGRGGPTACPLRLDMNIPSAKVGLNGGPRIPSLHPESVDLRIARGRPLHIRTWRRRSLQLQPLLQISQQGCRLVTLCLGKLDSIHHPQLRSARRCQ